MPFLTVPDSFSSLPLSALPAIVLDTETTGLDVSKDRIIEIGAVRLEGGRVVFSETFNQLVDPAVPIPAASTAVHTITDEDVAGQPGFPKAISDFAAWTGPTIVLGYAIGFDVAIMKAETARHGISWRPPRSLDVRHLVQIVAPNLPDLSLETVSAWLEIEVSGRHRALADAVMTAQVFFAIAPKLRDRGILTLAQAERACRTLTSKQEEEARAGWHEIGQSDRPTSVAEYARVDSFPYRHKVGDLMSAPPRMIANEVSLKDTLRDMVQSRVSSLFLPPAAEGGAPGIITERDILRAIEAHGADALNQPVSQFATRPMVTVAQDEYIYRALYSMATRRFRHLGVTGPDGDLVGALSARDLLHQRADDAVSLGDAIETAATAAELGRVWSGLTTVARALAYEDVDARAIAAIISRELRALTRRAAELAESELADSGKGGPPVPYALMVLGSGGRGESLLAMDQDNAIVFTEGEPGGEADQWFQALGKRVSDILNESGVVYCKGGVMAANAEWRMERVGWLAAVDSWIGRSRPEDILNCDIFFDSVAVHGDLDLAEEVRHRAMETAKDARTFLKLLALNASQVEASVGWFGRLKTEGGRIDVKKNGIMPIFSAARVVALEHGVAARSTPGRLEAARGLGIASEATINDLIEAHRILLNQILAQQLRDIADGVALSNTVIPGDMTGLDLQELKWALEKVQGVSSLLGTPVLG